MTLPDFLTEWAEGVIALEGHRIGLYHVIDPHQKGATAEQLAERFPTLEPALIRQVLDFYEANRDEVDAYVARIREEIARQEAAAPPVDYEGLRRRAEQKKRLAAGG